MNPRVTIPALHTLASLNARPPPRGGGGGWGRAESALQRAERGGRSHSGRDGSAGPGTVLLPSWLTAGPSLSLDGARRWSRAASESMPIEHSSGSEEKSRWLASGPVRARAPATSRLGCPGISC